MDPVGEQVSVPAAAVAAGPGRRRDLPATVAPAPAGRPPPCGVDAPLAGPADDVDVTSAGRRDLPTALDSASTSGRLSQADNSTSGLDYENEERGTTCSSASLPEPRRTDSDNVVNNWYFR